MALEVQIACEQRQHRLFVNLTLALALACESNKSMSSSSAKSELNHQPIWESSRRLLHPKCVWVGSTRGVSNRHFIFDQSLTNSYRARSDSVTSNSHAPNYRSTRIEKSQSFDTVETKMDGLSIVGAGDRIQNAHARSLNALNDRTEMMADICFEREFYDALGSSEHVDTVAPIDIISDGNHLTSGMKRINSEIDSSKNLLTERVLQWLDLAGGRGAGSLSNKHTDHQSKTQNVTVKRRSVTAKEQRRTDQRTDPHEDTEIKSKHLRREPLHQMSMTFNDDVLNVKDFSTTRNFFGDLFPTTYRCSRKFLTLRRPKNAIDSLEPLDLQLTLPPIRAMQAPRKSIHSKTKPKLRLEYCDDQYRSLIQREILETSCNAQAAKRQLHIFMPNFPKRCLIVNDCGGEVNNSTTTTNTNITNTNNPAATHLMSPKSIKAATDNKNSNCLNFQLAST